MLKDKNKIKVIYISGIGRSGSTLLDLIISTNPHVFSVGEIYKYNFLRKNNILCSCGKKFNDCNFWRNFRKINFPIKNRMNFKDYLKILIYLYNPLQNKINFNKKSENYQLYQKILFFSPKKTRYILDSSKDIGRLIELIKDPSIEVYNLNIIRDGRAVANSFNSTTQSSGKNYFVSLLKWIFMNSILIKNQKKNKFNHLNISYDQLAKDPASSLKKIENFLKIKIPSNYVYLARKMDYHNIGGNRLSLKENRQKLREISLDNKWRDQQNKLTKAVATVISRPLNKKLVYNNEI